MIDKTDGICYTIATMMNIEILHIESIRLSLRRSLGADILF